MFIFASESFPFFQHYLDTFLKLFRYFFLLLMLQSGNVYSQFTEVGLGVGGAVYYGDLTIDKAVDNIKLVRPNVGVFISHHFDDRWAVLAGLQNFTLIADDALNSRESIRMRNLSFKSNVWEFALRSEFYLIPFLS
jgi:hypothetical protein